MDLIPLCNRSISIAILLCFFHTKPTTEKNRHGSCPRFVAAAAPHCHLQAGWSDCHSSASICRLRPPQGRTSYHRLGPLNLSINKLHVYMVMFVCLSLLRHYGGLRITLWVLKLQVSLRLKSADLFVLIRCKKNAVRRRSLCIRLPGFVVSFLIRSASPGVFFMERK